MRRARQLLKAGTVGSFGRKGYGQREDLVAVVVDCTLSIAVCRVSAFLRQNVPLKKINGCESEITALFLFRTPRSYTFYYCHSTRVQKCSRLLCYSCTLS